MKITKNEKKNGLYELEIAVEKEVFEDAINKVYREQVAHINIPGTFTHEDIEFTIVSADYLDFIPLHIAKR